MGRINVRKRGNVYEYFFEGAKVNKKRTRISKSGFKTENEAYEEYHNRGVKKESQMSYADYLDYWMEEYFEINFKYSTAKRYKESFETIKKELGKYKLCDITPYLLNKTLLGLYQKTQTKETLRNYQKVIKSSLRDATYYFGFIGNDPAGSLQIPKILTLESKKTRPNMCIQ